MIKQVTVPGKNYFAWEYEDQTKIKHKVLSAYAKIWISKLGAYKNTIFFDCHGGCGAYLAKDGSISYGSSILIKNIANEINSGLKRRSKTAFFYCENNLVNFDNFKKVLQDCGIDQISMHNKPFEMVLRDSNVISYYQKYPTLFFVDPFGYNFDITTLANLIDGHGNEIIINFMFDFINRFISYENNEDCYNKFFGTDEWKQAKDRSGNERESFLVKLFKDKAKSITNAKYAFAYRLCYPKRNQTYYYLIHLTNHVDGISLMKSCFASINNGRVEYLGKRSNQYTLFDMDSYKLGEACKLLKTKFFNRTLSFSKILGEIIEDTAYTDKELRQSLKHLEANHEILINRITSKRDGITGDDEITFINLEATNENI